VTSEAPALLKLLEDPEEVVRDAALGALVELRDRRAVSVLAEGRSMRDRREMRKILDAIALLGGDEAADYLAFVADGHEDPEIRALAVSARQRLGRRGDAGR
jgi:HEAT repeat protein